MQALEIAIIKKRNIIMYITVVIVAAIVVEIVADMVEVVEEVDMMEEIK